MTPDREATGTHAQRMQKLRRHVAGQVASETNRTLAQTNPEAWTSMVSLTAWDILFIVQRWHELMAAEYGKSCLLSGRIPK